MKYSSPDLPLAAPERSLPLVGLAEALPPHILSLICSPSFLFYFLHVNYHSREFMLIHGLYSTHPSPAELHESRDPVDLVHGCSPCSDAGLLVVLDRFVE